MLTLEEALPVIEQLVTADTILVGGQAINLWATIFEIELSQSSFTRDIDFIGNASDALISAKRLTVPYKLHIADQNQSSINSAVIVIRFPNQDEDTPIDYLMTLYGLDRTKLNASAVEVEIGSVKIKVIHPILLMQSKFLNFDLPTKRTGESFEQAKISIKIVNEFLKSALNNSEVDAKDVLKLIRNIVNFAKSDAGITAYNSYEIDCLQSIPIDALKVSSEEKIKKFIELGYQYDLDQVSKFRRRKLNLTHQ